MVSLHSALASLDNAGESWLSIGQSLYPAQAPQLGPFGQPCQSIQFGQPRQLRLLVKRGPPGQQANLVNRANLSMCVSAGAHR